jgi:hypothetical protein
MERSCFDAGNYFEKNHGSLYAEIHRTQYYEVGAIVRISDIPKIF